VEKLALHLSPAAEAEQFLTWFSRLSPEALQDLEVEASAMTRERYWEFDAAWELVSAAGGRRTMASALAAWETGVTTALQAITAAAGGAVRVRPDIPNETFTFLYERFAKLFTLPPPPLVSKPSLRSIAASKVCSDRRPDPAFVAWPRREPDDEIEWRPRILSSADKRR
jgi:hypothetical protein